MNRAARARFALLVAGALAMAHCHREEASTPEPPADASEVPSARVPSAAEPTPAVPVFASRLAARLDTEGPGRAIAISEDGVLAVSSGDGQFSTFTLTTAADGSTEVEMIRSQRLGGTLTNPVYYHGAWYVLERDGGSLLRIIDNGRAFELLALNIGPSPSALWIDEAHARAWILARGLSDRPVTVVALAPLASSEVGEVIARLEGGETPVGWSASPSGSRLALASLGSREVRVFQTEPPAERAVFDMVIDPVRTAFLDEDRVVVSGQTDHGLTVLSVSLASQAHVLLSHAPTVFFPGADDRLLVVYAADGAAEWRSITDPADPLGRLEEPGVLSSLAMMGDYLVGAAASGADQRPGLRVFDATGDVVLEHAASGVPSRVVTYGDVAVLLNPAEHTVDVIDVTTP